MLPILPRTRRVAIAITLAFALSGAAAACGSDGGSDTTTTTTLTTDADGPTDDTEAPDDTEATGETGEPSPDAGDADRQDYVDALASAASDDDFATPEQSECLAEGWVDAIGVDELRAAGIAPEQFADGDDFQLDALDLDEATAGTMYDQFATCDLDLRELFLTSFGEEGDLTPDQQACVEDTFSEDAVRASFIADILGDDTVEDPFDGLTACFS